MLVSIDLFQLIAVKLQQLIIMEIYITCFRQYKNKGAYDVERNY